MYEDQTQNYDPEIHEEYLIHCTFPIGTSFVMYRPDNSIYTAN